jgi:hypothetical protein
MLNTVTRWPNGFTNNQPGSDLGDLMVPDPATYNMMFDDFTRFTATDWVVTETQVGATQGLVAGDGGLLALVNSAASADVNSIQWAGGSGAFLGVYDFDPAKDMVFAARFKISNATNGLLVIGLATVDTSPIASLPANGLIFSKPASTTTLSGVVRSGSASVSASGAAMADDTYVVASIFYTAADGKMTFYQNTIAGGISAYPITGWTAPVAGQLLAPTIAVQNNTAAAQTLTVDWMLAAKAR